MADNKDNNSEACKSLPAEMAELGKKEGIELGFKAAPVATAVGAAAGLGSLVASGLALAPFTAGTSLPMAAGMVAMEAAWLVGTTGMAATATTLTPLFALGVKGYLQGQWIAATEPETCELRLQETTAKLENLRKLDRERFSPPPPTFGR